MDTATRGIKRIEINTRRRGQGDIREIRESFCSFKVDRKETERVEA